MSKQHNDQSTGTTPDPGSGLCNAPAHSDSIPKSNPTGESKLLMDLAAVSDRLLRIDEAAAMIGMSPRWISRQFRRGTLTRIKLGRSTRIRLSDVQVLIQRGMP